MSFYIVNDATSDVDVRIHSLSSFVLCLSAASNARQRRESKRKKTIEWDNDV